jgi:hypothetical protein
VSEAYIKFSSPPDKTAAGGGALWKSPVMEHFIKLRGWNEAGCKFHLVRPELASWLKWYRRQNAPLEEKFARGLRSSATGFGRRQTVVQSGFGIYLT